MNPIINREPELRFSWLLQQAGSGIRQLRIRKSLTVFLCLLLAACSKEEAGESLSDTEICFALQIASVEGDTRLVTERNFKTRFEAGDEVGIYLTTRDQALLPMNNYADNVKLTFDGTSWTSEPPVYHSNIPGGQLDAYMYYPYDASMSDPTDYLFAVQTTQDIPQDFGRSDFLWASYKGIAKSTGAVPVTFDHALSLVQVELDVSSPDPDMAVFLAGGHISQSINLYSKTSGVATNSGKIAMNRVEQPADQDYYTSFTYRALVPSQTLMLSFNTGVGGIYYSTSFGSQQMERGKVKKYKAVI